MGSEERMSNLLVKIFLYIMLFPFIIMISITLIPLEFIGNISDLYKTLNKNTK